MPKIEITLEWIDILIQRGWEIKWRDASKRFQFRGPNGETGTHYCCRDLFHASEELYFPEPVADWLIMNVPMERSPLRAP